MQQEFPGGKILKLMVGDITRVTVDAIVNAANSGLRGGGGVDGAVHRAGGPSIMKELDGIRDQTGGCPTGQAVATGAGNLPARYVFHAAGPVYHARGNEADLLGSCYRVCLGLAEERDVDTIAFPSISTGIYSYPVDEAARVAIDAVAEHLRRPDTRVREAVFVLFDSGTYDAYARALSSGASA